jgi:hypothetical protein
MGRRKMATSVIKFILLELCPEDGGTAILRNIGISTIYQKGTSHRTSATPPSEYRISQFIDLLCRSGNECLLQKVLDMS